MTEATWEEAQQWESAWWREHPAEWEVEQMKQNVYALGLLEIGRDAEAFSGDTVLDIGCGPVGLLLRYDVRRGVAVDPLNYGDEAEAAYAKRGIERIRVPAEQLYLRKTFDEIWMYNCLQHVKDPVQVLDAIKRHTHIGTLIRVFEWRDIDPFPGHPHKVTEEMIRTAFPRGQYRRHVWRAGTLLGPTAKVSGPCIAVVLEAQL